MVAPAFEKKTPWTERLITIKESFPSTTQLDWREVFRADPTIFGRIISDIQKAENASSGRPGKRPSVDPKDAAQFLRQYENDDYTILDFKDAFAVLKGDVSVRKMATACGLTSTMVQRLLSGDAEPSMEAMEKIAKAHRKHPSFFVEYRIIYVLSALAKRMEDIPEASIVPYTRLRNG